MNEYLILVDKKDRQWGKLEKLRVHQLGELHRAISVFIFNSKGELLLQERAEEKYHSGGLWLTPVTVVLDIVKKFHGQLKDD